MKGEISKWGCLRPKSNSLNQEKRVFGGIALLSSYWWENLPPLFHYRNDSRIHYLIVTCAGRWKHYLVLTMVEILMNIRIIMMVEYDIYASWMVFFNLEVKVTNYQPFPAFFSRARSMWEGNFHPQPFSISLNITLFTTFIILLDHNNRMMDAVEVGSEYLSVIEAVVQRNSSERRLG